MIGRKFYDVLLFGGIKGNNMGVDVELATLAWKIKIFSTVSKN